MSRGYTEKGNAGFKLLKLFTAVLCADFILFDIIKTVILNSAVQVCFFRYLYVELRILFPYLQESVLHNFFRQFMSVYKIKGKCTERGIVLLE